MTKLIVNGWLQHPDFLRVDGHPLKLYTAPNTGDGGLACHSVVGEEADFLDGVPNRFLDDSRNPDGSFTDSAAASCMFILRKRMPHIQMYPTWASTWTSGSRGANTTTWAMEAEGGGYQWVHGQLVPNFSEPLTEHQVRGFLIIATAWEQEKGRKLEVGRGKTVRAHWQLAKDFGSAPTACESGRYRHAWDRLIAGERYEEDEMTREEIEALVNQRVDAAMAAQFRTLLNLAINGGPGAYTDSQGNPLPLIRDHALVTEVREHLANHAAGVTGQVPEHTHQGGKVNRP
ncbi:MAG TPA: hypothetical protein PKD75_13690 [Tepidiformaceae bacterium]|nr:hypothetical protein [Tepidiformaceae bacterium]